MSFLAKGLLANSLGSVADRRKAWNLGSRNTIEVAGCSKTHTPPSASTNSIASNVLRLSRKDIYKEREGERSGRET